MNKVFKYMFRGHLMRRKEPTQCLTCGEPLTVKHLFVYCQNYTETRRTLRITNNFFEVLSQI